MNSKLALLLIPALAACSSAHSGGTHLNSPAAKFANWPCQQLADERRPNTVSSLNQAISGAHPQREHQPITQAMIGKECSGPRPIVVWASP